MDVLSRLRTVVASVRDPETGETLGTCFPVGHGMMVTCYHVVGDPATHALAHRDVSVVWPVLEHVASGHVAGDGCLPDTDLALLVLDTFPDIEPFTVERDNVQGVQYATFGYRRHEIAAGLYGRGRIEGLVSVHQDRQPPPRRLYQIRTSDVGTGMSGAPLLQIPGGRVVGVLSEYWDSDGHHDAQLAFAVPSPFIVAAQAPLEVSGLLAIPREPDTGRPLVGDVGTDGRMAVRAEEIRQTAAAAAILLVADAFEDGAWARSLWRWCGADFTADSGDAAQIAHTREKKAVSVTSWAGQVLYKTTGSASLTSVQAANDFLSTCWGDTEGAFGSLYPMDSGTPLVARAVFMPNPRHTASAMKMIVVTRGLTREVIRSTEFLLSHQNTSGGWAETPGGEANTLSTAYVVDALVKVHQCDGLDDLLEPRRARELWPSIQRGLAWLAANQHDDGHWSYVGNDTAKPFYTTHILAFVSQLATQNRSAVDAAIAAVLGCGQGGGVPRHLDGQPHVAATAMLAYALSKIDIEAYADAIVECLDFVLARFLTGAHLGEYHVFDSIFTLMSLQTPLVDRSWWVSAATDAASRTEAAVFSGAPSDTRRAAVEQLAEEAGVDLSLPLADMYAGR